MKMLWTGIKSIINIKSNKFYNNSHLTQNGKTIDNPKDIAMIFNVAVLYKYCFQN